MNLDDLRTHLHDQATEIDAATPAPLPTIRRRTKTLKRRRAATILTTAAAAIALVIAVLPSSLHNSAPDPAKPPADYTRDGLTVAGSSFGGGLIKGWIGKPGETSLDFSWTPRTRAVTMSIYCRPAAPTQIVRVEINGRYVTDQVCDDTGTTSLKTPVSLTDNSLWADLPLGKPARVKVIAVGVPTNQTGTRTQLALGIYNETHPFVYETPLVSPPPPDPRDYVKDTLRFRAKAEGDTLATAAVGDPGQAGLKLTFTATGAPLLLHAFCTANNGERKNPKYRLAARVNGGTEQTGVCQDTTTDVANDAAFPLADRPRAGQPVELTVRIVDKAGHTAAVPSARLGVGAYFQGAQRIIDGGKGAGDIALYEVLEYEGRLYRLSDFKTVDATSKAQTSLRTPADKPFLVLGGSSKLGGSTSIRVALIGIIENGFGALGTDQGGQDGRLATGTYGVASRAAGTVSLKVNEGEPTMGKFVVALYLPDGWSPR